MGYDKHYPPGPTGNDPERIAEGLTFPGVDVYASWALGSGRDDFFPSESQRSWLPVLFELNGISPENFARGFLAPDRPLLKEAAIDDPLGTWRQSVQVSSVHLRLPGKEEDQNVAPATDRTYVTALVYVGIEDSLHPQRINFFGLLGGGEDTNPGLKDIFGRAKIGSALDGVALPPRLSTDPEEPDSPNEEADSASEAIDFGPWPKPPDVPPEEGVVVIAVIDDGIAFAHERFRNALDKTRIEYVWLQSEFFADGTPTGREITKTEIDDELANATSGGLVDEDAVYRHFGIEDFSRVRDIKRKDHKSTAQRASHGAHVMDVACGYPMDPPQTKRPMICVQLPTEITADTSGRNLEPYLIEAVDYIKRRADAIAVARYCGQLPVVINFSYGHASGPHDGTSSTERALDQAIEVRPAPLRIVLPSGNSHLSRTHAQISFRPDADPPLMESSLPWRIQPNDLSWSFMEIWLPRGIPTSGSRIALTVEAPDGSISVPLNETDVPPKKRLPTSAAVDDDAFCIVSYRHDVNSSRSRFLIAISPTDRLEPSMSPLASAGIWKVKLTNTSFDSDDLIHAWIQRDDTPFGYPIYGRQSYFDDPDYNRFNEGGRFVEQDSVDSSVKRAGTISGIATGDETIVVGGFYRREMRAAEYSSGGPTYDSDRVGPDASAVSDDTPVHRGILAAGTRSGSKVEINGTSVAAPQIARWVADELASGSNTGGDRTAVKNRAIIEETTTPERPPRATHERGGAGRIVRPPLVEVDRFER